MKTIVAQKNALFSRLRFKKQQNNKAGVTKHANLVVVQLQ